MHAEQHFYAQLPVGPSATAGQFKFSSRVYLEFENPPAKNSKLEVTCVCVDNANGLLWSFLEILLFGFLRDSCQDRQLLRGSDLTACQNLAWLGRSGGRSLIARGSKSASVAVASVRSQRLKLEPQATMSRQFYFQVFLLKHSKLSF